MHGRLPRLVYFIGHAPAHIKNDANRDRHVFARKADDFLRDAVLEYVEIIFVEAGHQAVVGVGDGDVHQGERDVHPDALAGCFFRAECRRGRGAGDLPEREGRTKSTQPR